MTDEQKEKKMYWRWQELGITQKEAHKTFRNEGIKLTFNTLDKCEMEKIYITLTIHMDYSNDDDSLKGIISDIRMMFNQFKKDTGWLNDERMIFISNNDGDTDRKRYKGKTKSMTFESWFLLNEYIPYFKVFKMFEMECLPQLLVNITKVVENNNMCLKAFR